MLLFIPQNSHRISVTAAEPLPYIMGAYFIHPGCRGLHQEEGAPVHAGSEPPACCGGSVRRSFSHRKPGVVIRSVSSGPVSISGWEGRFWDKLKRESVGVLIHKRQKPNTSNCPVSDQLIAHKNPYCLSHRGDPAGRVYPSRTYWRAWRRQVDSL